MLVSAALSIGYQRYETVAHVGILAAITLILLGGSYLLFTRSLIVPPLVPGLVSLAVATPLTLIRRSMMSSFGLDARLRELEHAETWLWPSLAAQPSRTAELIARITGARAVAILEYVPTGKNGYALASSYGAPVLATTSIGGLDFVASTGDTGVPAARYFDFSTQTSVSGGDVTARRLPLLAGPNTALQGILLVAYRAEATPNSAAIRLSVELATASLFEFAANAGSSTRTRSRRGWLRFLPHGVQWKAHALAALQQRLLTRARFVDLTVQSVDEGLIVSGPDGRIVFANQRAADILGVAESSLTGTDLFTRLGETAAAEREILSKLIIDRSPVEREIAIGSGPPRQYILRLAPVQDDGKEWRRLLGWVASLSDVTKERELQQMKADVMALVTHELRTPPDRHPGFSEVLSQFEMDAGRRREMHSAINEEAKRLAHMIDEYLDLTRLESGTHPMRLRSTRVEALVQRTLLLLDPVAARRGIVIVRRFPQALTPVLADPELLARAVTNLVANAIKYSRPETEVTVAIHETPDTEEVEVSDRGPGISPEHLGNIFEKFYRVPRVEDAETPGTGLGLTIVREIVERHRGTITVESVVGHGTTFRLRLPKVPEEPHQQGKDG